MNEMRPVIFIDRDGVVNKWTEPEDKDYGPNWYTLKWEDFEFLPGVFEAFRLIYSNLQTTYMPIVISNQSCIGKGYIEQDIIENIFYNMDLEITRKTSGLYNLAYYFCPHDTNERCACRKPSPGMLYQAAIEHNIVLEESWIIGDSGSDIQAGIAAGIPEKQCIKIGEEERWFEVCGEYSLPIAVRPSLLKAVEYILSRE